MLHGGIADRICVSRAAWWATFRGGLGLANVVACTLFGGVSGSPVGGHVGHGRRDHSVDEARRLQRGLCGQRDDAFVAGGRADAHLDTT
jgi:hypothetical protein